MRPQRPTALVAFTLFHRLEPASDKAEPSYAAFVSRSTDASPRFVPLGPAREIDALIERWQEETLRGTRRDADRTKARESYRVAAGNLRRRIWDPIAAELRDIELALLVPDGKLHVVSFATLPADPDGFLIERGPRLHYLASERDLVNLDGDPGDLARPSERSRGFLGVSNPSFDAASGFHSLAKTADEVREIVELLEADRTPADARISETLHLTGIEATETAFRNHAPGRRILHLATHGFYGSSGDPKPGSIDESSRGVETVSVIDVAADARHALLSSGLALARSGEDDDGVLLAEEVATLDLEGVEWAVLSACESGLGDIRRGEGVFGLQRAFGLAGARTLVLSLWPVEDSATREWMVRLYEARFVDGLSTPESVRRACLQTLRARRQRGESAHPCFWGAFVAVGDWK